MSAAKTGLLLILALWGSTGLFADILILPNGERLTGKYLGSEDGKIQFETEHLGVVQGSEDDLKVELETETVFAAYIPPLIALPAYAEELNEEEGPEPPKPHSLRAFTQSLLPEGWSGTATFGYSNVNTDSTVTSLVLGVATEHTVGDNTYELSGAYNYGMTTSTDGVDTKNVDRYSVLFHWTHSLTEYWSFETRSRYLKDMLRDIDHSATQSIGLGYDLVKEEFIELSLTPAIAGRYIDAQGFDAHWLGLATLYQNFIYHINGSLRLEQQGSAEYNPGQSVEYAYDIRSGLIADVSDWAEAGLVYEYNFDNIVGPGVDNVEERILVQLGIPF